MTGEISNKIGIVTVLYKSDDVLRGFFKSLAKQIFKNYILYVIDNSPTDSGCKLSETLAQEFRIQTKIHFNNENCGVAKGNNQGINWALKDFCDFILLSNNDIEFDDDKTLNKLIAPIEAGMASLVCPKIYYFGTNKIWFFGGGLSKLKIKTPHRGVRTEDVGEFEKQEFFEYAPTCFMMIKSSIFSKIGLMDENYFVYFDDTDFTYRASQRGERVLYIPGAKIYHKVSFSTGGSSSLFTLYYTTRNRIYFARKHFSSSMRFFSIFYLAAAMLFKSIRFDMVRRREILRAFKDGFRLRAK